MLERALRQPHPGDTPVIFETADRFDFGSREFRLLFNRARATAFQHPDWLTAFYRHLVPAHGVEPLVVTGRDAAGDLQLVVPLVRRRAEDGSRSIEYAFLGVTDYACPIVAEGLWLDERTAQAFHHALGSHAGLKIGPVHHQHVQQWRSLLGSEPLALGFGAHAVRYGFPYGEWRRANLGSHRAAALDRKARRLDDTGALRLELLECDAVRSAMMAGRDFRSGRFPDDPLQTAHGLEFYIDVATSGARSGLAQTWHLVSGESTVALVFGLIDKSSFRYILLCCNYVAHARYSPGRLALDRVMAAWAASGGETFDFTIGDEPFKADFGCTRTPMHEFR
ncbi:GNAT family N-acetyltransferase, partial [Mesorhizobium sp. M4A.F.Ca.ET.022.05.2.1]